MPSKYFKDIFDTLRIPVVVCRRRDTLPIVFMNTAARLVLRPTMSLKQLKGTVRLGELHNYLRFNNGDLYEKYRKELLGAGSLADFRATIVTFEGESQNVAFTANTIMHDGEEFIAIYMHNTSANVSMEDGLTGELLFRILHEAYQANDIDETINAILALAGHYSHASRVYIFEDISPEMTRNTYEWCAPGVAPAIDMLQNLRKDEYNYDVIISAATFIFDDTRKLPARDRQILYDMQGIKSIAILALYHQDKVLGYIGFDDTVNYRKWSRRDIQILEGIASVVSTLINRRNAEKELVDSREVMQTITDSLEDLIFVTDLDTYELKFVSKSLARSQGVEVKDLVGKVCWEVLHLGQNGPCSFCPIPDISPKGGGTVPSTQVWEFQNDVNGKWYLVKDSIIKWIDGKPAHLETAVDITYQKQYEEQLKYSASTDAMTAVYNREWGHNRLREIGAGRDERRPGPKSLVFLDLDNLKSVNDKYGHAVGDDMIVNTIQTIFACIRKDDFICRWGGDEFILLLYCDLPTATKVMAKIDFAIDHFNQTSNKPYTLSFSHGEVEIPASGEGDIDALIHQADALMYRHKSEKKAMRATVTTRKLTRRIVTGHTDGTS